MTSFLRDPVGAATNVVAEFPSIVPAIDAMQRRSLELHDEPTATVAASLAMARWSLISRMTESPAEDWFAQGCLPLLLDPHFDIYPQQQFGPWRVDFFCEMDRSARSIVVEIDGHEFHERTPQQASRDKRRDRTMTKAGLTVMRFTGSDVKRDAVSCAQEVYDALVGGRR